MLAEKDAEKKYNPKTRPIFKVCAGNDPCKEIIQAYEDWFEGFEKRQFFLLTKNEHGISRIAILLDKHNKLGLDPVQAIEWFIKKEILGE